MIELKDITIEKLKAGKLEKELPEFYELKKVIENNPWHNNESTFAHTLSVLKELKKFLADNKSSKIGRYLNRKIDNYTRKDLLYLATILHDLGKKETIRKSGRISSFPKHEKISVLKARKILKKFDLTKKEKSLILDIIKNHSSVHSIMEPDNKKLEFRFRKLTKLNNSHIIELVVLVMADTLASYLKKTMPEEYKFRINFYKEKLKTNFWTTKS